MIFKFLSQKKKRILNFVEIFSFFFFFASMVSHDILTYVTNPLSNTTTLEYIHIPTHTVRFKQSGKIEYNTKERTQILC